MKSITDASPTGCFLRPRASSLKRQLQIFFFQKRQRFLRLENFSSNATELWPSFRRMIALSLVFLLVPMSCGELLGQQQATPLQLGNPQQDYSGQIQSDESNYQTQPYPSQPYPSADAYPQQQPAVQPLPSERLEQLVAPIALYPDALVALVLTASTYPQQVQEADAWRQAQGNAPPEQIAAGANVQNWDPSVKALTAFPQVLAQMDQNIAWTSDLGTAYFNQPSDVLEAVQVMRARAQAAGNLQPTTQEAVYYSNGNIQLAPVNPQVVYVPAYNPWVVYGAPVTPYPGFSFAATLGSIGSFFATVGPGLIHWGPGIALTAFTSMPWGLVAWGVSWLLQAILFHNSGYYSNSTAVADWGFRYGGPRAAWRPSVAGVNGYPRIQRGSGYWNGYVHRPPTSNNYAGGYGAGPGNVAVHRPPTTAQGFASRPPNTYARPGGGYTTALGQGFTPGTQNGYSGYRPTNGYNRGYQGYNYGRAPQASGAPSNSYRAPTNSYRPPANSYRPPSDNRTLTARAQQPNFGQRGSSSFGGRSYGNSFPKETRSGFHGSSHSSEGFHASSYKAPKMKAPKSHGGGGHSGGKHH